MRKGQFLLATAAAFLWAAPIFAKVAPKTTQRPWWAHAAIYEIYPRSFQDSNGDGVGDLNGITQRLDYLKSLGIDAIWVTPFFPSPNADFGYDISDYTGVAAEYGTMADWDRLVAQAKKRNIRVLVDFVVNHTSQEHPWFKESRSSRDNPKRDWYIWHDGKADGSPPTNWPSIFTGGTWTLDAKTNQYYYHIFLPQQPDLNWANPQVRKAMYDVARFWLKHGASGFRLDATPYLFEDTSYPDDPDPKGGPPSWFKPYNAGRPEGHDAMRGLRAVLNEFSGDPVLVGESATSNITELRAVYGKDKNEISLPMDFLVANQSILDAAAFKPRIDEAHLGLDGLPPLFFFSSHDRARQWTNFGDGKNNDQIAKLMATLMLLQPGSAILYYGEELGMGDMPQSAIDSFPLGPKRPVADDRDKERTPMQWTADAKAGFTTGAPWLPINPATAQVNAAAQIKDKGSIFATYAALLKLRHENPIFRDGAYVPLESGNAKLLAFGRLTKNGQGAVIMLNMSDRVQQAHITGLPKLATFNGKSYGAGADPAIQSTTFQINPYGVQVFGFDTKTRPPHR